MNTGEKQQAETSVTVSSDTEVSDVRQNILSWIIVGGRKSVPSLLILIPLFLMLLYWGVAPVRAAVSCLLAFGAVVAIAVLTVPKPVAGVIKPVKRSSKQEGPLSRLSGQRLADFLPDPLVLFDVDGTILYINHAAREAFPTLTQDTSLYLCFRSPEMHVLLQGIIADGQARSSDYLERLPLERWYRASVMTFETAKGEADCFILIFRDQTELRRIDRMRSDFIANASHELRTPLASLRGFIETLQGPARNDLAARERFLGIMQNQADRMSRLIDDLLSLSRLEMKAAIPVKERVDIGQILNHVVETLVPMASEIGVTIEWSAPDHPVWMPGDRDELIQVFQNLIENACKYGQSGKRVVVTLDEQGGDGTQVLAGAIRGLSVSVEDFGPGIPPEHLPRLTERFYRVDVDSSRIHKGTGLGLAIVKHILTRHRGRLVIRSQLGKGAVFTVIFVGF